MVAGKAVVWLTARPTLEPTPEQKKIFLTRGYIFGPGSSTLPLSTVCLSVAIPKTDRRLHHYVSWLRKYPHNWEHRPDVFDPLLSEDFWFYAGDIKTGAINYCIAVRKTFWVLGNTKYQGRVRCWRRCNYQS